MAKFTSLRFSRQQLRLIIWLMFALFFVTIGLPLLFFYYLFDPQQVRQMVINQFNNQSYTVQINGSVEPRSWHGLSLFIADLQVIDKARHRVLHINTANCQLSWLDLILGDYRIKRLALNGLTFYQSNLKPSTYSDLLNFQAIANSEFRNLTSLSISNLSIIGPHNDYWLRDVSLHMTHIDAEPHLHLAMQMAKYNAQLELNADLDRLEKDNLAIKTLNVGIDGRGFNFDLQASGHYAYQEQQLWLQDLRGVVTNAGHHWLLNGDAALISANGLSINSLSTSVNMVQEGRDQNLMIKANQFTSADFSSLQIAQLTALYQLQSNGHTLNSTLQLYGSKISPEFNVSNDNCQIGVQYLLDNNTRSLSDANLRGKCSYDATKDQLGFELSGEINQAPSHIKLNYRFAPQKPEVEIDAVLARLDLTRLMSGGPGDLLPLYYDDSALPFAWLGVANAKAHLKVQELNLSHLNLNDIDSTLTLHDNRLQLSQISAKVYDGMLRGSLIVDNLGESYNIQVKNQVTNVNLQKLFASFFNANAISGKANLSIDASAKHVATYDDLHRKLSGSVVATVTNGGFSGIDFSLFLSPENLAAFQSKSAIMTKFTTLKSEFQFESGVARQSKIMFSSPSIIANGSGVLDFAATKIDYHLNVSSILPHNIQNIKSVSIPVAISGDLFNPKIYIQNMTLNTKVITKSRPSHKGH